jgi:hypothetical protein
VVAAEVVGAAGEAASRAVEVVGEEGVFRAVAVEAVAGEGEALAAEDAVAVAVSERVAIDWFCNADKDTDDFQQGPPTKVEEYGIFQTPCEGQLVFMATNKTMVPKFNKPV